jgi:hypothetical protein
MELVTCFMIALIALGACLGCPGLVNPPDSDGSNSSNGNSFDRVIFPNSDHPEMIKGKYEDGPGPTIGVSTSDLGR